MGRESKGSKLYRQLNVIVLIAFVVVVIINSWSVYERQKLNQRYKKSIEQFEIIVRDYQGLADLLRKYVQE